MNKQKQQKRNTHKTPLKIKTQTSNPKLKLQQERFRYGSHHSCSKDFKHQNIWLKQATEHCSPEVSETA